MSDYINCPWCGDTDYDLPGLKSHISRGHCEAYEACERPMSTFEILESQIALRATDSPDHDGAAQGMPWLTEDDVP